MMTLGAMVTCLPYSRNVSLCLIYLITLHTSLMSFSENWLFTIINLIKDDKLRGVRIKSSITLIAMRSNKKSCRDSWSYSSPQQYIDKWGKNAIIYIN